MGDYIVSIDENGQAYLAHASENGGWKNRATKYLGKFPNLYGNGKTAYAYTQQQLRAMQNYARGGARKAQNTVNTAKNRIGDVVTKAKANKGSITLIKTSRDGIKQTYTGKDAVKETAKMIGETAKQQINEKTREAQNKAQEIKRIAKDAAGDAVSKVTNPIYNKSGAIYKDTADWFKREAESAKNEKDRAVAKEYEQYNREAYEESPLGKTEAAVNKAKSTIKSKSDRMKEEFRNKKAEAKDYIELKTGIKAKEDLDKAKQNLKSSIEKADRDEAMAIKSKHDVEYDSNGNEWYKSRNAAEKAYEADLKATRSGYETVNAKRGVDFAKNLYDNSPLGKAEKAVNAAKDKAEDMALSTKRSKYSEYKENDSDFDDKNYDEKNRVGDTDFFSFKGKDGRTVIVEEDMKWTLPKGVDPNSPEIHAALKKFASQVESAREMNNSAYTGQEWRDAVTEAIDDASRKALKKK